MQKSHFPTEAELKSKLRVIPGWPKKGVNFIDITTLLQDPEAFQSVVKILANHFRRKKLDCIVGIEARGFIFGAPVAYELGVAFVPARKKGKLPFRKFSMEYTLEYGAEYVEMHRDALKRGQRVAIIDDLLATGGTAEATVELAEKMHGTVVGLAFVVELDFLKGRKKLEGYDLLTLVHYEK
ncbi:MAG: adenine phosphoribosyltransferase [Thaumarchaeota archaeon]|nr:adenine phosphoribosyltransferase [Nitrososphaerota archaeon]